MNEAIAAGYREIEVDCEKVFALIGADPDTGLLEKAGVEIASDGRPVYNEETFETRVPGLFVAGHLTRSLHMKNAIATGRAVAAGIAARVANDAFTGA